MRARALLCSLVAVTGLLLWGQAARAVTPHRAHTLLDACDGSKAFEPKDFVLTCADANDSLIRLRWTSWTPLRATAVGQEELNDCAPDCADGHVHHFDVAVTVDRPRPTAGGYYFSRATWRYTSHYRPARADHVVMTLTAW